jgi:hypothetical protein
MVHCVGYWFTQAPFETSIILLTWEICMEIAVMSLLLQLVHVPWCFQLSFFFN